MSPLSREAGRQPGAEQRGLRKWTKDFSKLYSADRPGHELNFDVDFYEHVLQSKAEEEQNINVDGAMPTLLKMKSILQFKRQEIINLWALITCHMRCLKMTHL